MRHLRFIPIVIACFIALAMIYAYATPIFEAPDEYYHVAMVQKLATDGQLPVQSPTDNYTDWHQEGSQPPLYYMISAVLVKGIDRSDYDSVRQRNPHAVVGRPDLLGNKNRVLHDPVYPPALKSTTLAVYVVRLFSMTLGALTVFAVYQCARTLFPEQSAIVWLATGLVAFNPQFLFISAAVNNDNLVTALNSVILWQTLVMVKNGFTNHRSVLLAVLVSLATLSKLGGLVMVVVVALAGLWVGISRKDWRGLFTLAFAMMAAWGGLASWWYIRNITLYGELFGTQTMLVIFGRREPSLSPFEILQQEGLGLRQSFWGLFGWFSVSAPLLFYSVMDALTLVAIVALPVAVYRQRRQWHTATRAMLALLGITLTIGFVSFMGWTMQTYASQGRLLFPYYVPIALFMALGFAQVLRGRLAIVAVVVLGFVALWMPLGVIIPTYAPQPTVTALPPNATPTYARYENIELVGYVAEAKRYAPTDNVTLTFYWRPLAPSATDLSVFVHLVKPEGKIIASITSYPNMGSRHTRTWEPNQLYTDTYILEVPGYEGGAYPLEAWVGWWQFPENKGIAPLDANGQDLGVVHIPLGAFATLHPKVDPIPNTITADFGGVMRLNGYEWLAETSTLTLWWDCLAPMSEDYTVFVFLSDADGTLVAQGDAPPNLPTRYWQVGEAFTTEHPLQVSDLPQGTYTLEVGWYRPSDFMRLPTLGTDNRFTVGEITLP